jgi:hypothetical protein
MVATVTPVVLAYSENGSYERVGETSTCIAAGVGVGMAGLFLFGPGPLRKIANARMATTPNTRKILLKRSGSFLKNATIFLTSFIGLFLFYFKC